MPTSFQTNFNSNELVEKEMAIKMKLSDFALHRYAQTRSESVYLMNHYANDEINMIFWSSCFLVNNELVTRPQQLAIK